MRSICRASLESLWISPCISISDGTPRTSPRARLIGHAHLPIRDQMAAQTTGRPEAKLCTAIQDQAANTFRVQDLSGERFCQWSSSTVDKGLPSRQSDGLTAVCVWHRPKSGLGNRGKKSHVMCIKAGSHTHGHHFSDIAQKSP